MYGYILIKQSREQREREREGGREREGEGERDYTINLTYSASVHTQRYLRKLAQNAWAVSPEKRNRCQSS